MPSLHYAGLSRRKPWHRRLRRHLWREWCFLRLALTHFGPRFLIMVAVLLGGALCFLTLEPERNHTPMRAVYYSWSLVFGQSPEEFPSHRLLQAIFFLMPIMGLTVIIEGIIDFSRLLRDRSHYEANWCRVMAHAVKDQVILVGLGKLGYRVFRLLRDLDQPVVVIERDAQNAFLDEVRREGSPFIVGDGRREQLLVEANIAGARSVILATDDDLANMEIALDARRLRPDIRVVLRMFDQNIADKIRDGFNIHLAMSQSAISAPAFAMAALDHSILNSFTVGDDLIVLQRWGVDAGGELVGLTMGQLLERTRFNVLELRPAGGGRLLFPSAGSVLAPGDELLVQGPFEALTPIRKRGAGFIRPAGGAKPARQPAPKEKD